MALTGHSLIQQCSRPPVTTAAKLGPVGVPRGVKLKLAPTVAALQLQCRAERAMMCVVQGLEGRLRDTYLNLALQVANCNSRTPI